MSLEKALTELRRKVQGMMGEKFNIFTEDIDRVRTEGTVKNALQEGQFAPDFSLPDAFGKEVSLKELLAKGPVVISFYRGEWCPYCNLELHALQEALPKIQALGATLVAISPEKPDYTIVLAEKHDLAFPVLTDFHNRVARQFGIAFQVGEDYKDLSKNYFKVEFPDRNGEDSYELPVAATYVLDPEGVIRFAHVDVDFMVRAEPEAILATLATLARPVTK